VRSLLYRKTSLYLQAHILPNLLSIFRKLKVKKRMEDIGYVQRISVEVLLFWRKLKEGEAFHTFPNVHVCVEKLQMIPNIHPRAKKRS